MISEQMTCPDSGVCHHNCEERCWRRSHCGPLSNVFKNDEWPEDDTDQTDMSREEQLKLALDVAMAHAVDHVPGDSRVVPNWFVGCAAVQCGLVMSNRDIADLQRDLNQQDSALKVDRNVDTKNLDENFCCNGQDCGCYGVSIGEFIAWAIKSDWTKDIVLEAMSKEAPSGWTIVRDKNDMNDFEFHFEDAFQNNGG